MDLNELSKKLRVIGDECRIKILCMIFNEKNICVTDIAQKLNLSIAIVSHHLQALKEEGILINERDGKKIKYKLVDDNFILDLKKFICKYKD